MTRQMWSKYQICATIWALGLLVPGQTQLMPMSSPSQSAPEIGFEEKGIGVEGRSRNKENGEATAVDPRDRSDDPNQYKYELQCHLGGGDFDLSCLGRQLECASGPDGKVGIPVIWLQAPVGLPNPVWTYHSGPTCLFDPRPEDLLPRIAATIQSEFQKLPVKAGAVTGQPHPHTLLGAETNFFAEASEQQFDITILGQKVHLVATPVEYTWNYGDGTAIGPQASAGGSLPADRWGEKTRTSHVYTQTGDFNVVLTTHFRGTYSVNNGPPLPIPGQGQFSSAPLTTSVWRSITRHYADNCLVNPQGDGCPGRSARK